MSKYVVTFDDLVMIARRTGVENYNGMGVRGKVVAAPSSHRGQVGEMGTVVGCVRHHTGTAESFLPTSDYPTYNVVKEGRSGLENSLSAFGLGRFSGIYVFSEDISWHAGTWSYAGITDGNGHFLGIEAEGTGAIWTPFQREFYPRLCASILNFVGEGIGMMPRHLDGAMPRGRKSDAANLWSSFSSTVQSYLDNPSKITYGGAVAPPAPALLPQEDDMLLVSVKVPGGEVPHVVAGDRYFRLLENDTAQALLGAKIPRIVISDKEHANFVRNLSSEADPKPEPAPAPA